MSGHSKWANIKNRKAAQDAKKSGVFTKLAKDITLAAKNGGNPEMNFHLKMAMEKAKAANMPKDNIERSIRRGTGEDKEAAQIEEVIYEAYGPGQVAMLIKVATDNKNRSLSEVKTILKKNNGKFAESGSVAWQFEQVGQVTLGNSKISEELEMKILETDAKDYQEEGDDFLIFTEVESLQKVKEQLEKQALKISQAELAYLAKNKMNLDKAATESYENLLEKLDENEDVVAIWDNLE